MTKKDSQLQLGVLVSGQGSNLQAIINACEKKEIPAEVVVVISDQPDAQALTRAQDHHIPALTVERENFPNREAFEKEILRHLQHYRIDLVCLAGYMRLVGKTLLDPYPDRIMNIHPSLLPAFPGLDAQRQALEAKAKVTGCTVHFVDEQCDHGPIILQTKVEVLKNDTVETLSARILKEEHLLYPKAIGLIAKNMLDKKR
ncbi:MAG: phosphoribosylglycinamide formyltransferase [Deltaproteobacteria bacterium RIFCSPLOWO2_02_FULL_44_10]|nr:MAG: phosphoribosylglycinamide formyltransferase [Deltaproteobacteria bacterium RIFCSPHIGHO2_02_FULL_44_16]OGQ47438.1 MAG: phosphoribosylglycinamide formyltransferase [Deltaproteobacteria bacterium RIFCSPLOWO2_02_FULL_44_10]